VRVVFLIIDGLPDRRVGHALTPRLAELADEGARATGRSVMTSATYPNHASFATGAEPIGHRLLANWVVADGQPRPAEQVGPAVPTIFDACRSAGRSSAAIVGDQCLIAVMGAAAAGHHWPPNGVVDDTVTRDGHGFIADEEVLPRLLAVLGDGGPDLVVGHLNEPDTAGHVHGPDSAEAAACYTATDARLGTIIEAMRPQWDDTVVIVVSDHDQETASSHDPIDLYGPIRDTGVALIAIPEGNGAVVWGDDPTGGSWLDRVEGVDGHGEAWPGARLVWADPGRRFRLPRGFDAGPFEPGQHGGSTTRDQVAVVAGGHPAAAAVGRAIRSQPPRAVDWAPTMAALLEVSLPTATGRSLA
jgi:arylsulfatase A-like enzyme